ncbi:DNA polymerase beta superfamily protein [Methylopila musalis]|uniref:DNA polymerase beta superfamily protein n=1 Tax=Methylopila musalis TaxID=1134781 RepID=A0ABW3Z9K8_9HYPH
MLGRSLPADMDADAVAGVDRRLAEIRAAHGVAIPLAIESGSRAWGFPSPDSDYDCRFIYAHRPERYLSLWPLRDVIETPIEGELDVNGWDLAKAIRLLLNGNAVVIEWLTSPIAYGVDERFRAAFLAFAEQVADRDRIARHYRGLGYAHQEQHLRDGQPIALKKLFYMVRPAAALRWLRLRPDAAVAPMRFQTLMAECDPPPAVAAIMADLIARKALTRELGAAVAPPEIIGFIADEFRRADETFGARVPRPEAGEREQADRFFRDMLDHIWRDRPTPDRS